MLERMVSPRENAAIARPRRCSNHSEIGMTHHTSSAERKTVRTQRKAARKACQEWQSESESMPPPSPSIAPKRHQREPERSSRCPSAGPVVAATQFAAA